MNRYFVVFLSLALTGLANAQTPSKGVPADQTLTWQDCVQLAASNNPDLLSALAASESSRSLYLRSYNGVLPQVSLSNNYINSKSGNLPESKTWTAAGTASLDLIDFSQWASIQSGSAGMKLGEANYRIAAVNALLALYRAFTSLRYAQDSIAVNTTIRETWKVNSQMVNLRYQSGRESKGNNMNTEAQALQADVALDQSNRDLHVAQQQLGQAMGKDRFETLVVTGTWSAAVVPMPRPDFDALLATQPQIEAQQAAVDQARAQLNIARSAILPTLSLAYTKGTSGPTEFPNSPFWTFTGSVNYPLFGNGLTYTYFGTQAAQRLLDKTKFDMRSIRNQIRSTLETAWSGFAQAQDQVHVQSAFLQAAKQRKEESDVRYRSGLMTFEEWNLVIQDYVNFQQSFLRAQQNLILAEAQWRFALGEHL